MHSPIVLFKVLMQLKNIFMTFAVVENFYFFQDFLTASTATLVNNLQAKQFRYIFINHSVFTLRILYNCSTKSVNNL